MEEVTLIYFTHLDHFENDWTTLLGWSMDNYILEPEISIAAPWNRIRTNQNQWRCIGEMMHYRWGPPRWRGDLFVRHVDEAICDLP
jgi:hypothetical protein